STNDVTIGLNPANQPTVVAIAGSIVDTLGGGVLTAASFNVRNGTISANVATSTGAGAVTVGNIISNDTGGTNVTSGTISGNVRLVGTGGLVLISGDVSGAVTYGAGITMVKHSTNTVTLSGNNVVAGAGNSTINAGTLVLDYSTNTGTK